MMSWLHRNAKSWGTKEVYKTIHIEIENEIMDVMDEYDIDLKIEILHDPSVGIEYALNKWEIEDVQDDSGNSIDVTEKIRKITEDNLDRLDLASLYNEE